MSLQCLASSDELRGYQQVCANGSPPSGMAGSCASSCSSQGPVNTMWRKLLHSGFETCFGPSTQDQNTSQIQILRHFENKTKKGFYDL